MGASCYEAKKRKESNQKSNQNLNIEPKQSETQLKPEIDAGGAPRVPLDIYNEYAKGVCKLIIKSF